MRSVGGRPRRNRDVVSRKFSDRASSDLRREADLERRARGEELGWAPLLPGSSHSGRRCLAFASCGVAGCHSKLDVRGRARDFPRAVAGV